MFFFDAILKVLAFILATVQIHLYVESSFWILVSLKGRVVEGGDAVLPLNAHLPDGHRDHLDDVQVLLHRSTEKVTKVQLDKVLEFCIDATPVERK